MLIDPTSLHHWIDYFYGYGSWKASIWFVAFEDGGGDLPEEVAEKLNYFQQAHPAANDATLCDIRKLYRHSMLRWDGPKAGRYTTLFDYRFGPNASLSPVWKNLIAFAHAVRGEKIPDALVYQKKEFGNTDEALIKLYPLPSPHNHAWYYSWLDVPGFGFLKSRDLYQAHVFPSRINAIMKKIRQYKPGLVLMYGMQDILTLKGAFQQHVDGLTFQSTKAIKQVIPQHHRAEINGTKLILTTQIPTLRHNRAETGFDWEAFGKAVR